MDFIGVLLLLALLYGLPEILRKKRKKNYEYPSVPKSPPVPEPAENQANNAEKVSSISEKTPQSFAGKESGISPQAVADSPVAVMVPLSESSPITPEQLRTAIVWTEIIGKPKQVRPYGRKNLH